MKKDIDLIAKRVITTYMYVISILFVLKLFGFNIIQINQQAGFIKYIDKAMSYQIVKNLVNFTLIMTYQHIMLSIASDKPCWKLTLISIPFTYCFQAYLKNILIMHHIDVICEILYLFTLFVIYNGFNKNKCKKFVFVIALNFIIQFISSITRFRYSFEYITSITMNLILNLDYLVMMLLIYKINMMKGDKKLWEIFQAVVGSFLQKLTSLKKLFQKFLTYFSKKTKKEKFEISLYLILNLLWNAFTVACVIFVGFLNNTLVECIFILTAFWLNKTVFGKAFHLKNAFYCFIVSNLTYYCLNRITLPLDLTLIVPLLLGILLAYITSRFTKTKEDRKILYRGMPKNELKDWLSKINISEDSIDYNICKYYYVDRFKKVKIASMVCYSIDSIKKRKKNINDKLKELRN